MIWVGMFLLGLWAFAAFDAGVTLAGRRDLVNPGAAWAIVGCMLIALTATGGVIWLLIRAVAR